MPFQPVCQVSTQQHKRRSQWITGAQDGASYMAVQDDGPDEAEHNGWSALNEIRDVDVHQLDLGERGISG